MASLSSFSVPKKHKVFLSFRGQDTRNTFTSHLHAALERKGIDTFIDYQLERGEEISPALLTAIEESKLSVVVLSKNYASSSWCLDELSKILECKKTNRQKIVPIFYHVDPSHVRYQKGSFEEAFAEHQERFKDQTDKVDKWRAALFEVASLAGCHIPGQPNDKPEFNLIVEIVEGISKKLMYKSSINDTKCLIGIDSRIKQMESKLCFGLADVRIVGIWGLGGIGKTTIAEVVYSRFFDEFDVCYFLENVKGKYGEVRLREDLFSKILEDRNLNVGTSLLPHYIKDRFQHKKVLIVLDDVDDSMQLHLSVEKQYFGPGSRIILTSRDKQVLKPVVDDDEMYKVEELNHIDALELFSLCAFKQSHPKADFLELSKKVVHHVQGLPLALRVLGSTLYSKSKLFWEDKLDKLKEIPNPKIDNILKISFDELDHELKDIFLDIACFFKGHDRDYVKDILDGCYRFVEVGMSVLIDKSLITIQHKRLGMHDLVQQMAWNIVNQDPKNHGKLINPGKRSRLWTHEDICHVLKHDTGTDSVEGMFLDISEISREVCIRPTAFVKMHNLKFLKFNSSDFQKRKLYLSKQGLESLPNNLRLLHWDCYPSKSLPSNFYPENLVELNMPKSNLKRLWNGEQNLVKLKRVDLSGSQHLTKISKLSRATNLESITLDGCTSLVEIPSSIRCLNNLSFLSLENCHNLGNFPSNVYLRSLKTLILTDCSNVTKFPEISRSIVSLHLDGTAIEEVPSSIRSLSRLTYLYLEDCKRLERLPSSICELKFLKQLELIGCSKLKSFPEILKTMECLEVLFLSETSIEELPSSIENLVGLITLSLSNCKKLKNLPSSIRKLKFLENLNLNKCSNFTKFPEIPGSLMRLDLDETAIEQLPSSMECLSELQFLNLYKCAKLGSLPRDILKLKYLHLVSGFSKLEVVQELLGIVQEVYIGYLWNGTANISLRWSTENQNGRLSSNLSLDELVNLRYSIGNMRSLQKLHVSYYPVFDGLLDNLENLESLKYLRVNFCNLFEIPSCLTCISSLRELDLSGNKFETIPSSIKQLFKLEKLDLSCCERLQSLPELPPNLQYLDAHCCSSLEAVSSLFTIGLGRWVTYLFDNCLKLDQNTISHILAESQLRIEHRATEALKLYHEGNVQSSSLLICLPGCEIPEWFSCQSTGSSVTTQLPLCGDDHKFVGFALCAILEFEDDDEGFPFSLECKYNYKTNNGDHHVGFCSLFTSNRWFGSDHMFLAYDFCLGYDWYNEVSIYHSNEASFEFYVLDLDSSPQGCCKVKCGIHPLYAQNTICPVSLPYNAIVIQPSGSGSSDLPYAKDAEECNSIVIYEPSSSSDPTWLSLKCGVNNHNFGEPMVDNGVIIKRCRCYDEAEPSGSFNPGRDAIMILPSSSDDRMWLSLNCGVIDQGFGEPMQEDANDADECTSIIIYQSSSSSDPTWLSLKCGVNNQDFGEPMVEDGAIIKRCHCYDEAEPSGSFNTGRDALMILPRSPDDRTWISLNYGVIDQGFGEPMQEDVTINKRSRDDHHNNEAEPGRNFSSEQLEEEPHPKRLKCTKFF